MFKYSKKNPLNQIYGKVLAMLLITLITITLSFLAATIVPEARPLKHVTPDIVMRQESLEITPEYEEAINASLRLGDGRIVNWREVRGA